MSAGKCEVRLEGPDLAEDGARFLLIEELLGQEQRADRFPLSLFAIPAPSGIGPAGRSTDELKDLGGWKSRVMADRHATFATEHSAVAASRIESDRSSGNMVQLLFVRVRS